LISQTTKTNAKEKKRRTEKDFLKYLTLEKKEEKKETITITYVIFCLIDNNTNKKREKERRMKKNMIHNTYDAITTSGKKRNKDR
jgi:prophage antirepressor-like protein